MNQSLIWLGVFLPMLADLQTAGVAAENDAVSGDRVFGTAKVVQFHLKMTEQQFAALVPKGGGQFGPPAPPSSWWN